MTHDLKVWPGIFVAMLQGLKRAEYRKNDRGFQVGDVLNIAGIEQGSRFLTSQFGPTPPHTDLEPGPVF